MKLRQLINLIFIFAVSSIQADTSGYLNLRARVNPVININFQTYKSFKNKATFVSMKAESNSVSFETDHKVEIEENLGLDIELEEENYIGKTSKEQRYKITPKNNQSTNLSVVFKISAN